jgi:Uma2 family endonuclease
MTSALSGHREPWTDEEYLALGETAERMELLDGSILLSPSPTPSHQWISRQLANHLDSGSRARKMRVFEAVDVRLRPGRIPIPDIVVTSASGREKVVEAHEVALVVEILSPSSASMDKTYRLNAYATAGIPWYLVADQDSGALHLYRLDDGHYVAHSITEPGGVLRLTEPVEATIRPEDLVLPD